MDWMGSLFLPGGALLFLSVVSTTLSARLGMPLLLVSPANVLDRAAEALAIEAFLMLVARPPAVFGGLWKFNYSGLNLNQDKATKPQTVQIVRQGEATPYWFKFSSL